MVKKHYQFTGYFIPLYLEKKQEKVISNDEAEDKWEKEENKDDEEKLKIEDMGSDEEDARAKDKRKETKIKEKYIDDEEFNKTKPI